MMKSSTAELDSITVERLQPVVQRPAAALSTTDPGVPRPERTEVSPNFQAPAKMPAGPSAKAASPEGDTSMERAKWVRLIEVFNLNADQGKALEAKIAEALPSLTVASTSEDYAKAGTKLEAEVLAVLTPEQQEAFKDLQERDRDNRVEALALEEYLASLTGLDLTPEQRAQTMKILRKRAKEQLAAVSDSTRLALSGSVLPIGSTGISDQALIFLSKLKASGDGTGSQADIQDAAAVHREGIADRMKQFDGILTPGQSTKYQLGLEKSLTNWDLIAPPK